MNQTGKKTPQEIYHEWFLKNKESRFNKWCKRCQHSSNLETDNPFCQWFGEPCQEAIWFECPIPSALLDATPGNNSCLIDNSQGNDLPEKGDTVVSPSKFHFVSTETAESQSVIEKTPRPHGSARAHAGDKPLAPTQNSHKKCGLTECPFHEWDANYCRMCSYNLDSILKRNPLLCQRLINGSCDGHACCCENFHPFNPDDE